MERERVMTVSPMATGQAYSVWAAGHAAIPADPMLARQVGTTAERQHRVGRALDLRTVPRVLLQPTARPCASLCNLMSLRASLCILILMRFFPPAQQRAKRACWDQTPPADKAGINGLVGRGAHGDGVFDCR